MGKGANKLGKYLFMKGSRPLSHHLPKTKRMTQYAFRKLITKYGRVFVKPNGGSGGARVIKITARENGYYGIHTERNKKKVRGMHRTYAVIAKKLRFRKYIVQRGIKLATVNQRPFDVRIIVQRKKHSSTWHVTGEVAKVAGKGYIVTNNTRSKGKLLSISTAIRKSSLNKRPPEILKSKLHRVALLSARRLVKLYPRQRIFGLDMGLDRHGHVWIIEANKAPSMSHFLKLNDKKMYRKIKSYKKR